MSWLSTTAEMALFNVKSGFLGASNDLAVSAPIDLANVPPPLDALACSLTCSLAGVHPSQRQSCAVTSSGS